MPSFFIFEYKVDAGIFNISAAPPAPETLPLHVFKI